MIAEIHSLQSSGYQRAGNWNLTQICEPLTATMLGGLDGMGYRLPWIVRSTYMKWEFLRAINKRKIGRGYPTLGSLKPKSVATEGDDSIIEKYIEVCRRTESYPGPMKDNPLLNQVSVEDWRDFMWVHAAHHLGFLIPNDSRPDT